MIPNINEIELLIFDFDGVFTDNKVLLNEQGLETVVCDRSDGLSIDWLNEYKKKGILKADLLILSQETNLVVAKRAIKLNLPYLHCVNDKYNHLKAFYNLEDNSYVELLKKTIYLGNDVNDLKMMKEVGYSVAPSDAHYIVRKYANLTLNEKGGHGFVRKFVEIFLGINEMDQNEIIEKLIDKS